MKKNLVNPEASKRIERIIQQYQKNGDTSKSEAVRALLVNVTHWSDANKGSELDSRFEFLNNVVAYLRRCTKKR